jgi:hypothetical protein
MIRWRFGPCHERRSRDNFLREESAQSQRVEGRRGVKSVNAITEAIIGDAIAIHREMGPGLLESTYEACLVALLSRRGMKAERQVVMPVVFQGERLDCAYRPSHDYIT